MNNKKKMTAGTVLKVFFEIILALVGIAFLALVLMRERFFAPETMFYNMYNEDYATETFVRLYRTLVLVVGGLLVMKVASIVSKTCLHINNNSVKTVLLLVGNVVKYVTAIAVIIWALNTWGIDTAAIVTGAGVLTLIVGLGCQTLVSDIVAGIFMLFEGDIKVGDIVVINGWRGTVQQIGLRRTRIIDIIGNVNIVNNSSISNIINNTQQLSIAVCPIEIDFDESLEKVEAVLSDNLDKIKQLIPTIIEGPYYKGLSSISDSVATLKIVARCKERDKYQIERDINREMKLLFERYDIASPNPAAFIMTENDAKNTRPPVPEETVKRAQKFVEEQKILSKDIDESNG